MGLLFSIHALREEGDVFFQTHSWFFSYFYPRPPRGGRPIAVPISATSFKFLSTPSARRATKETLHEWKAEIISIHALREEGDPFREHTQSKPLIFLSTPSARRATQETPVYLPYRIISIHALREEGDRRRCGNSYLHRYFYPRPPRGGRQMGGPKANYPELFLSTPSARRATL